VADFETGRRAGYEEATQQNKTLLVVYAVRNKEGRYFHAKGYGGCGSSWVDSLSKARIWPKSGPARAQVTFFATHYPKFGVPELVELHVTKVVAVDESERVRKSQQMGAERDARRAVREAQWKLERTQKQKKNADAEVERLKRLPALEEETRRGRQREEVDREIGKIVGYDNRHIGPP
jgi:hypothetical protein